MKLQGPPNCGGLSFDGIAYEPDADGIIDVPDEAAAAAFAHGFVVALVQDATKPEIEPEIEPAPKKARKG